jgi:hypothetical protein
MTDMGGGSGSSRRPRSSAATSAMGSPGLPTSAGDERLAELEARLQRLESSTAVGMQERGRAAMNRVMPADASRHFRNAAREQLLGFRSIVDFWIRRVDDLDRRAGAASEDDSRQTISID